MGRAWIADDLLAPESGGIRLGVDGRAADGRVQLRIQFLWADRTVEVEAVALLEAPAVEALADALDVEAHADA
jgi:hypothetical protein